MTKKRMLALSLLLISAVLFSACAAAQSPEEQAMSMPAADYDGVEMEAVEDTAAPMQESLDSERGFATGGGELASAEERMVIYNANLQIAVEDPLAAMESVIAMAEGAGGFVVNSNTYQSTGSNGRKIPHVNLTVRVPAGQLDSIMDQIKGLTPDPSEDVLSENVSGQDVTAEYTDLESRLRNLEAAEAALVELMDQAQDTEDVLDIFDELTYYRGEIESVKGRMQYLEESAALSAITVEIVAKESLQPIEIAGWEPKGTVKKAVEALINTGQTLVDGLIWLGIYCLPFLIPLGVAIHFLVRLIRKRKARKQAGQVEEVKPEED